MSIPPAVASLGQRATAIVAFVLTGVVAGVLVAVLFVPAIATAAVGANGTIVAFESLPSDLKIQPLQQASQIYATSHGKPVLLANFYAQNREEVSSADIGQNVKNAAVAGEDQRYYTHGGVDVRGVVRAAIADATHRPIQGASTITQQYVKNVCLQAALNLSGKTEAETAHIQSVAEHACQDDTIGRKVREMRLAIGVEKTYNKDQILTGYLNIAGFGGNVYGVETASEYYFGQASKDLSIANAAALMAIVNNPENLRLDEKENLPDATARRAYILGVEKNLQMITAAQYADAMSQPITPHITQPKVGCDAAGIAGFFCDYVVNTIEASPQFGKTVDDRVANLETRGWRIYTTLDLDLQKVAQGAMNRWVPQTSPDFAVGGAAVSVQVGTGRVLAMVQNKEYSADGSGGARYTAVNYNVPESLGAGGGPQPGSTAKLYPLTEWLETGHTLFQQVNGNARTTPVDAFTKCGADYGQSFQFGNDTSGEKGPYTVMAGTAGSVNGVFVSMGEEEDLCKIRDLSESMGGVNAGGGPLDTVPSMVIGGASSIAPISQATGYATIANHGVTCAPIGIDTILNTDGSKVAVPGANCHRTVPEDVSNAVAYALHGVIENGTMAGDAPDDLYFIGKTGTTDHAKDTWAIGSSSKVTTAVWVGPTTGDDNLRAIYDFPYCAESGGGTQAALVRHCIWSSIQYAMDKRFGGAKGWAQPDEKFLDGGVPLTVQDAKPVVIAPPKPKPSKPAAPSSPTTPTGAPTTGPTPPVKH